MNLSDYLKQQTVDLVTAFNDPAYFPIAVSHPDQFPWLLKREHTIEFDPQVRNQNAFVRLSKTGSIEYWVHINYRSYRAAFLRHLHENYSIEQSEFSNDWHADHILSRTFSHKFGVNYVRMCLLHKDQNTAYGRKFERNILTINKNSNHIFLMDYLHAMKVFGIKIPRNKQEYHARKSEIANTFIELGIISFDLRGFEISFDQYFSFWDIV